MAKKINKKDVDEELLDAILNLEKEWKHIQSIVELSIEPTQSGLERAKLTQAKYLFLLREARHRRVSARKV
ncbi:DUF2508 family protein [Oceanobacillus sp. 143]|uniref:DUF2508 domain-containing protein n=1 Tax=Oceanobacillus zhaokaii TaxID=2052660 RepID=A0A345PBY7_9BACI|nr:YaaL family protein [Oceanobacillus zhaokaii]AXI07517.1 DUF2508 domain-containing protein [Oceanobacillus zhaokaii]QGS67753.1 DUF2508 family protein [Oceanobacillus sp. 143]